MYGTWPENQIDHINGVRHDNRIDNLRDVLQSTNAQNQRKPSATNKCGFLGVNFHKCSNRWIAQIHVQGKKKHLGLFDTPKEAHEAYVTAKRELHEGCTI